MHDTSVRLPTRRSRERAKFETQHRHTALTSSTTFNAKRERRAPPDKITHLNINGGFRTDGEGWYRAGGCDGDRVNTRCRNKVVCQVERGRSRIRYENT